MDISRGEAVEHELNRLIGKRQAWIEYHESLCRLHTQLATEHEEKAQRLLEGAA